MEGDQTSSFIPVEALPKIPKIQKRPLQPEEEFNQKLTKRSCLLSESKLPQQDYLSIYKNKTILFLGDNTIRVLYRDLTKMLSCDRLLDCTEAACANGHYKSIEGETLVLSQGPIASDEYQNVRVFRMANMSITVIYIYLATIFNSKPIEQLNYLRSNHLEKSIDLIFLSSYNSDMNHRKISSSNMSFQEYFDKYMRAMERFSIYLKSLCANKQNLNQLFYWITPIPNSCNMSEGSKVEFNKIIADTNTIVTDNGFGICNRFDLWSRRPDLVIAKTAHFSLHGVREINDWLCRDVAIKWHKPYTSSIPPRRI